MVHTATIRIIISITMNITDNSMVDIHCHILYGTDDGARSCEESVTMLKQAASLGYKKIVATSHYPSCDEEGRGIAYELLKDEAKRYGVELYLGREIMITPETLEEIVEGDERVSQGKRYLLIEFQVGSIIESGRATVKRVVEAGYLPVIAHVERYGWSSREVAELKKQGAVLQMNIRAAANGKPLWQKWLKYGMIDILATDSHRSEGRSYELEGELTILRNLLGVKEFARVTDINPQRILEGSDVLDVEVQLDEIGEETPDKESMFRRVLGRIFRRQS